MASEIGDIALDIPLRRRDDDPGQPAPSGSDAGHRALPRDFASITDAVLEEVHEWQNRPREEIYPIMYPDALVVRSSSATTG